MIASINSIIGLTLKLIYIYEIVFFLRLISTNGTYITRSRIVTVDKGILCKVTQNKLKSFLQIRVQ